jgi:DNA-binding transcriptional LysR family regulator
MRHSTIRQLEVFTTAARLGSFIRTAEELFLTPPTVSMQIKKLTDVIGLPLFEQIGKKMYLTDAGRELYRTCRGIFEGISQFEMIAADMKGMKTGKLRLAVVTTAKYFTPRLLGAFCRQYPGIDVSLTVSNRDSVLARMTDNLDDLYILGQLPEDVDEIVQAFLGNPLVVFAPANHPLVNKKNITLRRIAQEPFISREYGSGTRMATERVFSKQGLKLKARMELGSNEAIKQAVIGGLGISVLSRHTTALGSPIAELAELDVQGFPIEEKWYCTYPVGKQLSIVAQTFLSYLQKAPQVLLEESNHLTNTGN